MFSLPELLYPYNALEPTIDETTMRIHHTKHHQTYIDKLNAGIKDTAYEFWALDELLKQYESLPDPVRSVVRNHGGGHANHSLFWTIMTPGGKQISEDFSNIIVNKFGSLDELKTQFTNCAINHFGSGRAWLVKSPSNELKVYSLPNQEHPLMRGDIPLLGIDVWEHAYYLQYQNKRADYVNAWWGIVDWGKVEEMYNE